MQNIPTYTKGLIFDLDGTLVDSMPLHYISWRDTCKEYGIDLTIDILKQMAGKPMVPSLKYLDKLFCTKLPIGEFSAKKESIVWTHIDKIEIIPEVLEYVKYYHGKLPMSVGTGSTRKTATRILDNTGLNKYFTHLVCGDEVKKDKPDPETFLKCAELIKVEPTACVVFEDGQLGIDAANVAGMHAIDVTKFIKLNWYDREY
ncbi:MAG: HAD family hydrolase [Bacteroidales bacterium]